MIRVHNRVYGADHESTLVETMVDADGAYILDTKDISSSILVLTKGEEGVAWFDGWTSAVKVDHLKESDEQ